MDWIIDQNYIASLPSHSPLELPMGSRVTEAAKEKAREKNILIRFIPGVLEPKNRLSTTLPNLSNPSNLSKEPPPEEKSATLNGSTSERVPPSHQSVDRMILTAFGVNRPRVLATISQKIADFQGNIEDISQKIVEGYFYLIIRVDLSATSQEFSTLKQALESLSKTDELLVTAVNEKIFQHMHRI